MAQLTPQQANILANDFLALSQAVGQYRYMYNNVLHQPDKQMLSDIHWSLLNYANDLFTFSAVIVLGDVQNELASIASITQRMANNYKKIKNVQKAIEIASVLVNLGGALMSGNPIAIINTVAQINIIFP